MRALLIRAQPRPNDPAVCRAGPRARGLLPAGLALLPPARHADGMAKPLAKLVALIPPKRTWLQFRLRTLFVLVAIVALPCAWLAWKMEHKRKERALIAELDRFGVYVERDWVRDEQLKGNLQKLPPPPGPIWFRWLFGDDFFAEVVHICLPPDGDSWERKSPGRLLEKWGWTDEAVDDDGLRVVAQFSHLESLQIGWTEVGDAGLAHLVGMHLRGLALDDTNVSDAGLVHVAEIESLEQLWLSHNDGVTDTGLAHLKRISKLKGLFLDHCPYVTNAGVAHIQGLTRLETLWLNGTQVTDAGLGHLHGLTGLGELYLDGTQITDAGLPHLQRLAGLKQLCLTNTQVTDAGLAQLRQALPNCSIYGP